LAKAFKNFPFEEIRMAGTLPSFSLTVSYFMFILAVVLTSMLMLFIGGWIKDRMQKGGLRFGFAQRSKFRRKFFGFLLFVIAIFLVGWLSERLQNTVYQYLMQNAASSATGIIIAMLLCWFMYDFFVWRKYNH
jgi:biotin transporter BioY